MRDPRVAVDIPATDLTPDERLALAACAIIVGTETADLRSLSRDRRLILTGRLAMAKDALRISGVKPRELRALGACLAVGVGSQLGDQERQRERREPPR